MSGAVGDGNVSGAPTRPLAENRYADLKLRQTILYPARRLGKTPTYAGYVASDMHGIGVPLATPFAEDGDVDHDALADLVDWLADRGVGFLVPCGSSGEAELLTLDERAGVVETVVDATPADVDVLAGTGHPGLHETLEQTQRAAGSGADAALVVTPFYYPHDAGALTSYYHQVAEEADLPVYLYGDPARTDVTLEPVVVGELATHPNVHGLVDASGDLEAFQRIQTRTEDESFDTFTGASGVFAAALDAGGDGGVLPVANVVPERANEIFELHRAGKDEAARTLNRRLLDLSQAITVEHGVPGLKAAMRARGAPAGYVRRPHQPVDDETSEEIGRLVEAALP